MPVQRSKLVKMTAKSNITKNYFHSRISDLGLTEEAAAHRYGITSDRQGNILQSVKHFDGTPVQYTPPDRKRSREAAEARRSDFVLHEQAYTEPYQVVRYHPEALRRLPGLPKYKTPAGAPARPVPGPLAIEAYNSGKKGGTVYFIEGYFKAVALDLEGLEATAFLGITHYQIKAELAAYLNRRQPDNVVILYDADALQVKSPKPGRLVDDRRPQSFLSSATRFARQFFALAGKQSGLAGTRLFWGMVAPDSPHKGIDDLLQAEAAGEIRADLAALRSGKYFTFRRLHTTTTKARLTEIFALDLYRNFYARHRQQIAGKAFRYKGQIWEAFHPGNLENNSQVHFRLKADPYRPAGQKAGRLVIEKYLAEVAGEIRDALAKTDRLAIEAPTGSGKTTFFANLATKGSRVIVAAPTIAIARQQAAKYRNAGLMAGATNNKSLEKALAADLVFCTYDQLPKFERYARGRTLVIDEAHNLVNHFGDVKRNNLFRAEVLRELLRLAPHFDKTVFLSGTMPPLLVEGLQADLLQIRRQHSNKVEVTALEADKGSLAGLAAVLLAELQRADYGRQQVHFALFNNTEELETIRAALVEAGTLAADQIEVITRTHYNAGENRVFDSLMRTEKTPAEVRLVLSSCLIAEGVNIQNTNIGKVFTVGRICPDQFRQYVARFRQVERLEVTAILPAEKDLAAGFASPGFDVSAELADAREQAALQVKQLQRRRERYLAELPEADLEIISEAEASQPPYYTPRIYDKVYLAADHTPQVDLLKILAEIRQEALEGSNNAYFLQQITAAPNIELFKGQRSEADDEAEERITDARKARQEARKAARAEILEELQVRPAVVVAALADQYRKTYRQRAAELKYLAADQIEATTPEALEAWLADHGEALQHAEGRRLVFWFARLAWLQVPEAALVEVLENAKPEQLAEVWQRLQHRAARKAVKNWRSRTQVDYLQQAETLAFIQIEKHLADARDAAPGKEFSPAELARIIQPYLSRTRYSEALGLNVVDRVVKVTPEKAAAWLRLLFEYEAKRSKKGMVYVIGRSLEELAEYQAEGCNICTENAPDLVQILQGILRDNRREALEILALQRF